VTPTELAWAAGFFDGEGTVTVCSTRLRYPKTGATWAVNSFYVGVNQATSSCDDQVIPEPLTRFRAAVEIGTLVGPYLRPPNRRPMFKWHARNRDGVTALIRLWPFLCGPKRDQARRALDVCIARFADQPQRHMDLGSLPEEEAAA
jgi:hypothetical protein